MVTSLLEKIIKETYPGKTKLVKFANKDVKQLLYAYVPSAQERGKGEHGKEGNGRYRKEPNGACRKIPIVRKLKQ